MVEAFGGFEPQVGEIRALRTFRIGPGGELYPLHGAVPWTPGTNTAACRTSGAAHRPAEPRCSCGFYAYAPGAVDDEAHAEHVLAVVACWGRVVAGTRGLRCEYARVEALWLSDAVPPGLAVLVARVNPGVWVHADRAVMVAQHPPTALDCYEPDDARPVRPRALPVRLLIAAALLAGLVPVGGVVGVSALAVGLLATVLLTPARVGTALVRRRRLLVVTGLVLWLLAPLAGIAGLLLVRLPLLELALIGILARRRLRRDAARFPATIS